MSLDNLDHGDNIQIEGRYTGDRMLDSGAQLILDTAVLMADKHKTLPPKLKAKFALAFKELNDKLALRQDKQLERRQEFPTRLLELIIELKLEYLAGRKRALIGREAADQMELDRILKEK